MANINPDEVEKLIEDVARQKDEEAKHKSEDLDMPDRDAPRRDHRDRDRADRHDRDYHRDRNGRANRESNGDGRNSEERERRRRDGSRPRSSKDANTEEDVTRGSRDERDRHGYRGGGRRGGAGGDFYSGGGRMRSRSPRRDDRRDDRRRSPREPRRDDDRRVSGRRRTATPEVTEDDRDKRTIFVQQISQRAEQRHLRQFFEVVGEVVEAQIVKDRVNGRSKGVGYVEFKEEESVAKAIELTGKKLKGVPIIAQLTEAEKNRASRTTGEGGPAAGNNGAPFHRLYVGNIHFSVTETDLEEIFLPYGALEQVTLQRDVENPTRSKGYGFVQFEDPNHAKAALQEMNGFELAGRQIRVGLGNDKFTPESTAHLLRAFPQQAASYQGSAFSGAGGRGAYAGGSGGVFDRTHGKDDRGVSGASALDDSDMSGVNFKQVDRAKLMANLARDEFPVPTAKVDTPIAQRRAPVIKEAMVSKCIKIENAFDPDHELKEHGANWTKELEEDVKTECDKKYGEVVHIAVDANSDGDIYVKFKKVDSGKQALQGLNGRSFNYRTIRASYVVDKIYNSLYGAAAKYD